MKIIFLLSLFNSKYNFEEVDGLLKRRKAKEWGVLYETRLATPT